MNRPPTVANYTDAGLTWQPMVGPDAIDVMRRIEEVCESWVDTPYMAGQQGKGPQGGVDCIRFVCGVLDELFGEAHEIPRTVQDISMHNIKGALRVMKLIQDFYPEHESLDLPTTRFVQPGDVIVVGQAQGGPGHAILVGAQQNTLYQALKKGVKKCGFGFVTYYQQPFAILRVKDPTLWL